MSSDGRRLCSFVSGRRDGRQAHTFHFDGRRIIYDEAGRVEHLCRMLSTTIAKCTCTCTCTSFQARKLYLEIAHPLSRIEALVEPQIVATKCN